MERLPIWLSAVGERTARPGTADMNRFPLNGMRQLRLPMALIERPVQGHSNEEGTGAPQQGSMAVRTDRAKMSTKFSKIPLQSGWKKFVRKPAANFIGRNKSPEFYVTFRIVTRCTGVNKITQPEMR